MISKSQPLTFVDNWCGATGSVTKYSQPDPLTALKKWKEAVDARSMQIANLGQWSNSGSITYDNGFDTFNECTHQKLQYNVLGNFSYYVYYIIPQGSKYMISGHKRKGGQYTTAPTVSIQEPSDAMRARAWAALYPDLNDGFSLFNFLWEFGEIAMLFSTAAKIGRVLKGINMPSTKTLAEVNLAYAFGIRPLYSDILSIIDLLKNSNKKIEDFKAAGRKPNSYHYKEELDSSIDRLEGSWTDVITTSKSTYHATLKCTYDYDSDYLASLARLWGLRVNAEEIWNILPFSFCLDWVLGIQDALAQFNKDPSVKVSIIDYCDSIKTETEVCEILKPTGVSGINTIEGPLGQKFWSHKASYYHRIPGLPNTGFALPASDELSGRELVLGGSLLRMRL
jgi:hypothetical protein